ncbi:MAG TPA: peptide deformylase [Gaiellales bacterium]|nr:peptide deformylase [Gaiellales bacterium]
MAETEVENEPEAGEQARDDAELRAHRAAAMRLVRQYPDPALRVRANPVGEVDGELRELVARMAEVMERAHGAGLAAPQIGVLRRVLIYRAGRDGALTTLVNPELSELSDEHETEPEGCLSLLGGELSVPVERHLRLRVRALDGDGAAIEFEAEGLEARVIQHEVDHLDGVLIIDRTAADDRRAAMRELRLSM